MWKPFFIETNFTVERSEIVKEIGQEKTDEEKGKDQPKRKGWIETQPTCLLTSLSFYDAA